MKKQILTALAALLALPGLAQTNFRSITFDEALAAAKAENKMVFIDFYTDWCGPCKLLGPTVETLAERYDGKARVGKITVDQDPELARHFGVMSIPTLLVFEQGKLVRQAVGARPKAGVLELLG